MAKLEIACNKLSSKKMCPDRFSEKAPCCLILVSDELDPVNDPRSPCILGGRLRLVLLYFH